MVSKDVIFDEHNFFYNSIGGDTLRNVPLVVSSKDNPVPEQGSELVISKPISDTPDLQISETSIETREEDNRTESLDILTPYPKYYTRRRKEQPLTREEATKNINDWPIAIRKEKLVCVKPLPHHIVGYLNYEKVSLEYKTFLLQIQDIPIPKNPQEAMRSTQWKEAMDEEMRALMQNQTWEVVDLPKGKKPVGCRWVYTLKCRSDGSLDRYKARLVARGYTQTYGIDYHETFAPVAKMNTIRILISLAVNLDWPLYQYDIKNAFLYGNLKEEIYMKYPPRYEGIRNEGKVCNLRKALYELKQSPRAWFGRFSQAMKTLDYHQCNGEHTLFFDVKEIKDLEQHLTKNFDVKQLGPLKYFLGIEFASSSEGILMAQQKYILELLEETKHTNCHTN